jgi:hypothetical protein
MEAVCDVLEQLLEERILSGYAVGGATAAGFHGEPLATRDVDVFVFVDAPEGSLIVTLDSVFRRLDELGFREFEEEGVLIHGFPVQFISASPGLETEAVDQALVVAWETHRLRIIRPEYLAVIALSVGRPKDRARLVYLTELPDFDREQFRQILIRYGWSERWKQWASGLGLQP